MEHTNVDMNCESCINDSGLDMDVLFDLPNLLDFTFKPDTIGKWSFNVCPHHGLFTLYTQKRCWGPFINHVDSFLDFFNPPPPL